MGDKTEDVSEIKRKPVGDSNLDLESGNVTEPPPNLDPGAGASDPQTQPQTQTTTQPAKEAKADTNGTPVAPTDEKAARRVSRKPVPSAIEIDKSRPEDFEGEVQTNNEIPSAQTLKEIEDFIVLDSDGKSHAFKTLYSGTNVARRVLVIFIRHFFCGMCQDYVRELSATISPEALLRLPLSTSIAIVGCGDPAFIPQYITDTNCKFQIYTDPKRSLFTALGMNQTLNLGTKPDYVTRTLSRSTLAGIAQGLKAIPRGLALKGGNQRQVGGEFLFEPRDLVTPVTTPHEERTQKLGKAEGQGSSSGKVSTEEECCHPVEEKRITWCHRMKTTRDHCEMPELMEILGLTAEGLPTQDQEKWQHTMRNRKGTGQSMARQMSELSALNEASQRQGAV